MKGIILAGGSGTRLFPVSISVCKQLLPVFDKPMIYYPLSVFMLAGIRDILIISTKEDISRFEKLFQNGKALGLNISYAVQEKPNGIAQAFIIGENFIGKDKVSLILGDNIFYGHDLPSILLKAAQFDTGGVIFGYHVKDPKRYGVVTFNENNEVISLEEKPKNPSSNYAVPGLYFYDENVVDIAKSITPSSRGELEITDINKVYLANNKLFVQPLGRGFAWLDTGTHHSLLEASLFVQTIQERQGIKIACIEEIAYRQGYIDKIQLLKLSLQYNNEYGQYLKSCIESEIFS
jgi:glucose-1-phosphate thymidylyltransferase